MRIDKYFSSLRIRSRSEIKKELKKGNVKVNDVIIKDPSHDVKKGDIVKLEDKIIEYEEYVYYILNKPQGYVCARMDNLYPTVLEIIDDKRNDLSPVGRLDKDTEGILLITNDGALLHDLMSPKKHVSKTYYAEIAGIVNESDIESFKEGLDIGDEKKTLPAKLTILSKNLEDNTSKVEITIIEGRYHQVKRMIKAVGKEVTFLKRISIGNLKLNEDLKLGECIKIDKKALLKLINNE